MLDSLDEKDAARPNTVVRPVDLLRLVFRRRRLIAGSFVASFAVAVAAMALQTPVYQARVTIEVRPVGAKALEDIDALTRAGETRLFETVRTKLLSRDLAHRVVKELALADEPSFLRSASPTTGGIVGVIRAVAGTEPAHDHERQATDVLMDQLSATVLRNTTLVRLTFDSADPIMSARVVNQVADSFLAQWLDQRAQASQEAYRFIAEQVADAKARLEQSKQALIDYAQSAGITLDADPNSPLVANIAEINRRLTAALQDRLDLERHVAQIDAGAAGSLPHVFQSVTIQRNKDRIVELKAAYQENLATLKPGYPSMRRIHAQISELDRQASGEIGAIANSIRAQFERADAEVAALRAELAALEDRQSIVRRATIRHSILQQEVDSNRAQHASLVAKLNDVVVGGNLRATDFAIIDRAVPPDAPIAPRPELYLGLAMMLGGLAATSAIYLHERFDGRFGSIEQIERELGLPVLGVIPKVDDTDFEEEIADGSSSFGEALRCLRTALRFAVRQEQHQVLLVTSAEPSEGKTLLTFKLAEAFAELGERVLVMDADMRRPGLHRMFKIDNAIGLSDVATRVLKNNIDTPLFRFGGVDNLDFMTAGEVPSDPTSLLASDRMRLVLDYCAARYQRVIIDSPPILGFADAPILAQMADATLLCVSHRQVDNSHARRALHDIQIAGAQTIGAVVTKFDSRSGEAGYAAGHAYGASTC